MKKFYFMLAATFLLGIPTLLKAQKVNVVSVSETNDVNRFYSIMRDAFPIAYNDPASPRFIFFDKDKNFLFGVGGDVTAVAAYDFNGLPDYNLFTTSSISPKDAQGSASFGMSVNQSSLFFKLIGDTKKGRVISYVNMMFDGPNNGLQLRQAFIKFKGLTVGQEYTLFSDISALPNTIDFEGPSSAITQRQPMIAYEHNFDEHWKLSGSLEYGTGSYTNSTFTADIRQKAPDIPIAGQYTFKNGSHLRAAAIVRFLEYKDLVEDNDRLRTGWGVNLSGDIKLCKDWTFEFQGLYGQAVANYVQDLTGLGYDLVRDAESGRLTATTSWGGYGALNYQVTPTIQTNAVYSYNRLADVGTLDGNTYKYAQYAAVNVIWELMEYGEVGIEYDYGRRNNFNGEYGNASRINLMMSYKF